jgi:Uma2 family endonuclease
MAITSVAEYLNVMPDASQLYSEEPEMESSLHYQQLALLVAILEWIWRDRQDFFIGANLSVYFSREFLKNRDFRGPDFFLVKNTERRPRNSWVVWEEGGRYPDLIIELLSPTTAEIDREIKKDLYETRFRTPEYFLFAPDSLEFQGYSLVEGKYRPIESDEHGRKWSMVLEMFLGIVDGRLRYFDRDGLLVASPEEDALISRKAVEYEAQRAAHEAERADKLAAKLRELGVNPDKI